MQRTISLPDGKLNFETSTGSQEDLVLLCPFPFDSRIWEKQIKHFEKKFRLIVPDFRNFGKSEFKQRPWSINDLAMDLKEILDSIKSDRAIICGLSMGGYVALEFASLFPDCTKALVLSNTKASNDTNQAKLSRFQTIREISKNGTGAFSDGFLKKALNTQPAFERAQKILSQQSEVAIMNALMAMASRLDHTQTLENIQCPTLAIHSEDDQIIALNDGFEMSKKIKNAQFKTLQNTGHLSLIDNPDDFNQLLADFIDGL